MLMRAFLGVAVLVVVGGQHIQQFDLNGQWSVTNGSSAPIQATVPGQIHIDLLNANIIGMLVCVY